MSARIEAIRARRREREIRAEIQAHCAEPMHGSLVLMPPRKSLRDEFAMRAMQAEIITSTSDATPESADALIEAADRAGRTPMDHLAFNAYQWADAMLKARKA